MGMLEVLVTLNEVVRQKDIFTGIKIFLPVKKRKKAHEIYPT
jgi:hypothetical protein